jgi:hypothetical protein
MHARLFASTLFVAVAAAVLPAQRPAKDAPWVRHAIDDTSRGADGVRLADVNGDGLPDVTTGWEEGGITRLYLHPGRAKVKDPWPAVTVGKAPSVEDAVFADLDGDGAIDVVSSCEGKTRAVFAHWAPKGAKQYADPAAWRTEVVPVTQGMTAWMFALPMQIDGKNGIDLLVGSKAPNAVVGWLESPADGRKLAEWKFHKLYDAGWVMSLIPFDVNGDGHTDVVVSDRKGKNSGVLWLENPGPGKAAGPWAEHRVGASGREVMFADVADLDGDERPDILVAVKPGEFHWFRNPGDPAKPWPAHVVPVKLAAGVGTAKAVRVGDVNGDGKPDVVYTCEQAAGAKRGVVWLEFAKSPADAEWTAHDISGPDGIKYDRIELLDLDGDGDLDVMTCEEQHAGKGLGVVWYENPHGR